LKPVFILSLTAILTFLIASQSPVLIAQSNSLAAVLDRAAEYVARYEEKELGNLLVAETYSQNVATYYERNGVTQNNRRKTESDFLILALGDDRVGLRLVNKVDGKPAPKTPASFEAILSDSSASGVRQLRAIQEESSRYNIGPIKREINVPTLALKVARKAEAPRFSFSRRDTKKISGVDTWEVRFQEQRAPTLTHGIQGESLLSSGALWIEPESGRILKTELRVENPFSEQTVKAVITVTYKPNESLGMLVPVEMEEEYTTRFTTVTAVASYSNYRLFKVDVKSSVEEPPAEIEH
jgi:hypothetical protein